ncbi:hypothetical protein Tco_0337526 [Tanacetum coccineum]
MVDQQNTQQQQLENQEQQHQDRPDEELVHVDDEFWHTVNYDLTARIYFSKLDDQTFEVNADLLREALQITSKDPDHPFVEPYSKKEIISFINRLGYLGTLTRISDMASNRCQSQPLKILGKGEGLPTWLLYNWEGGSRVDEMILARKRSGFAVEKVWGDIPVVTGF